MTMGFGSLSGTAVSDQPRRSAAAAPQISVPVAGVSARTLVGTVSTGIATNVTVTGMASRVQINPVVSVVIGPISVNVTLVAPVMRAQLSPPDVNAAATARITGMAIRCIANHVASPWEPPPPPVESLVVGMSASCAVGQVGVQTWSFGDQAPVDGLWTPVPSVTSTAQ